jgi:flavin reductase (DIM6/NTAB) family NADH-FMN oxidoreductase RutF
VIAKLFSQNVFSKLESIIHQPNGFTTLEGVVQTHHCEVISLHNAGDHQVVIAQVVDSTKFDTDSQVLYHHKRTYCGLHMFKALKKIPVSWQENLSFAQSLKPVVVLTTRKTDEPIGFHCFLYLFTIGGTIFSLTSVSMDPPLVQITIPIDSNLFNLYNNSNPHPFFALHVLSKVRFLPFTLPKMSRAKTCKQHGLQIRI